MLSSVGIKAVVDELAPQFEKATKHKVTTVFGLAGALKTQIEKGEPFDVAILTPPLLDDLIAKGLVSGEVERRAHGTWADDQGGRAQARHQHGRRLQADAARGEVDHVRDGGRERRGIRGHRQAARDR